MGIPRGIRVGHGNYGTHNPETGCRDKEKYPRKIEDGQGPRHEPVMSRAMAHHTSSESIEQLYSDSGQYSPYGVLPKASSTQLIHDRVMGETRGSNKEVACGLNNNSDGESNAGRGLSNGYEVDSPSAVPGRPENFTDGISMDHEIPAVKDQLPGGIEKEKVLKLSPARMFELASSPNAYPLHVSAPHTAGPISSPLAHASSQTRRVSNFEVLEQQRPQEHKKQNVRRRSSSALASPASTANPKQFSPMISPPIHSPSSYRPAISSNGLSTPVLDRSLSSSKSHSKVQSSVSQSRSSKSVPTPLNFDAPKSEPKHQNPEEALPSPELSSIPLPPLSLPAFLHLELSSEERPSPLYIHRSANNDYPYEPSHVKIERLLNFLLLPPLLEQVLWFGALACLDAWLYSFTILPLRFSKAVYILGQSLRRNIEKEFNFIIGFIYAGSKRMWRRRGYSKDVHLFEASETAVNTNRLMNEGTHSQLPSASENSNSIHTHSESGRRRPGNINVTHRRTRNSVSTLMPNDKADILKGLLIILSCWILMYFDASMMYHSIRGQAAIKLYVIYNVLEVCDRLLSALGQDVLECLLSTETLKRKSDGRSKIWRPFWLFMLALLYNLVHSTALFYQVITLNVAVNSYSNALLTLLMSNQFVEIKSTVFKKFEKDNLFQLTCADVVERFQLWLMLMIIASRNIIETNSLGVSAASAGGTSPSASIPLRSSSILPFSFTVLPDWIGQVLSPFLLVLGTEMLVDWLKHAYINKFNNVKPNIYGRFLDVLAKDYYSNAFADQNLTRRLGLPVIPLSCLFIRASVQTYHMFLATASLPLPSASTSLTPSLTTTLLPPTPTHPPSPFSLLPLLHRALTLLPLPPPSLPTWLPTPDALLSALTTTTLFLLLYLVLLAAKLLLGMCLLGFSRSRYAGMKRREGVRSSAEGKRVGGWGVVEVDEEKRRWIYEDDKEGLRRVERRERGEKGGGEGREREKGFGGVRRYDMVAKRIW
ncbi:hypothetical protein MMC13_006427 [Lambiella insularis]|nr:hypothetical protein [Lambiella insularis]